MKKILIIDDSALMRRIFTDILKEDGRFEVAGVAKDGLEALVLLENNKYDALVLDINMPNMNGIEFLEELKKRRLKEKVIVASTDTADGAEVTIKALELGALDFVQKPKNMLDAKRGDFRDSFLNLVETATETKHIKLSQAPDSPNEKVHESINRFASQRPSDGKRKIVALACSTGGPNALQHVIPYLPAKLDAPVLLVQHMPKGFTKSLADRLNSMSQVEVSEAVENEIPQAGHVYISKGGMHLRYEDHKTHGRLYYTDEPPREGVKPAANYMYESLIGASFDEIVCVVLTGMGQDGTIGIKNLKEKNNIFVITQDEPSCTVYGMPKAVVTNGLSNITVPLDHVAQEIVNRIGVKNI